MIEHPPRADRVVPMLGANDSPDSTKDGVLKAVADLRKTIVRARRTYGPRLLPKLAP